MTRGYSLEQDLKLLINNPKYSDIEILCEDKKKLHGCRAILAARSEVFDRLLYNGMKESYEKQISFPKINSSGMEIILEYIYTGLIKEESLTKDNIAEAFYAADYFQLPDLQNLIIKNVKNNLEENYTENYSPELLSKAADIMSPFLGDNILLNLLVEAVAIIPLNNIEFGRLSITALQFLLSCTHEKEKYFMTSEYEVFRYSAILVARQVSNDAYKTLMEQLPTLEQIKNSVQIEHKPITDHQKVAKELESLIKFIDFRRIKGQILVDIIEPLEIIPILSIYRHIILSNNSGLGEFRGIQFYKSTYIWDKSACGSKLIIEDNGKVVYAQDDCNKSQSVRAKMMFEDKGIFEWDINIVEDEGFIGVCATENYNYEVAVAQSNEWGLGFDGEFWNSEEWITDYCPNLGNDAKITVHLDMNKKTLAFTVNGKKYPDVSCSNLPSKLHPVVSLNHPNRIRIKNNLICLCFSILI